jgi:tetratricopeptide (TPR) repeat protein
LTAADPKNSRARLDLAISYERVADILSESEPAAGAEFFRRALAVTGELLQAAPNEFRYIIRHARFHRCLAAPLSRLGSSKEALRHLLEARQMLQALPAKNLAGEEVQAELHYTIRAIADQWLEMRDHEAALEHYRQALTIAEASATANPSDLYSLWRLADTYSGFGKLYAALAARPALPPGKRVDSWREARAWYLKSLDMWDRWGRQAVSSVFNTTRREQAARALAQCDLALAGLGY